MTPTAKGYYIVPPRLPSPDAYPLTKVDHALAPVTTGNELTDARIKYLLAYAKTPGQGDLPEGFVPFPGPVTASTTTTSTTSTTTTMPSGSTLPGGGSSWRLLGLVELRRHRQHDRRSPPVLTNTGPNNPSGGGKATAPRIATPKLALISANDGMALPIVFGLGLLALLYLLIDLARRRGPAFVTSTRQKFAARKAGSATAAPPGATP